MSREEKCTECRMHRNFFNRDVVLRIKLFSPLRHSSRITRFCKSFIQSVFLTMCLQDIGVFKREKRKKVYFLLYPRTNRIALKKAHPFYSIPLDRNSRGRLSRYGENPGGISLRIGATFFFYTDKN